LQGEFTINAKLNDQLGVVACFNLQLAIKTVTEEEAPVRAME
jgi:hypothetical protein